MGLFSAIADVFTTSETNRNQVAIANANNQAQRYIAEQNNQMQRELNAQNNAFAAEEAQKTRDADWAKMLYQNEYNSPLAQIKRYRDAGLNPAVMMSGSQAVASSQPGPSAMATPHGSGVVPAMPSFATPSLSSPNLAGLDLFEPIRSLRELSKMKEEIRKTGAEADQIESLSGLIAKELEGKIKSQDLQNQITEAFGMLKASNENQLLLSQIATNAQSAYELASQGRLNDALAEWNKFRSKTEDELRRKTGAEADLLRKQFDTFDTKFKSDLNESRSRAYKNYSEGTLAKAQTETENMLRNSRKALLEEDKNYKTSEILKNEDLREKIAKEILEIHERTRGQRLEHDVYEAMQSEIMEKIYWSARNEKKDYFNPVAGILSFAK